MSDFNNVYLNQRSFDELRHSLLLPDIEAMTRRDNEIHLFDENVCISRNETEVILEVDDEYFKSLSLNTSHIIHDEKAAEELLMIKDWLVKNNSTPMIVDRKLYQNWCVKKIFKNESYCSSELFVA